MSNGFEGFNFQLEDHPLPKKPVEGPSGPHLFRISQESSRDVDFYLSMSPPMSPEEPRAGPPPQAQQHTQQLVEAPLNSSTPLQTWTPRQVAEWMHATGFERSLVGQFFTNDISGTTLIDLQYDDLKELGITSFGHRHRLWNEIRKLKGRSLCSVPPTPAEDICFSPVPLKGDSPREASSRKCSSPDSPENDRVRSSSAGQRHARRARRSDDVISPAESASIVAIEQLLPKPHKCSKGENCSKWQKQQRKLAKIATEFPLELQQIANAKASPTESASVVVPSLVASSDLLGPAQQPPVRLEENALKVVQSRDPQENVRQFLDFQHLRQAPEDPPTPPYEMFPPLSPPKAQAPHSNLRSLPKLTIPMAPAFDPTSPNRTAIPSRRGMPSSATMDPRDQDPYHDSFRINSPASEMDVPVTAIPLGPIERDVSSSVPPDMRYGGGLSIARSSSRAEQRRPPPSFNNSNPASAIFSPIKRSTSHSGHRRHPSFAMAHVEEYQTATPTDEMTPTTIDDISRAGWMKKRKTRMLRHEWQENHFRLHGTRLAMHRDENCADAIDEIDVDDYAVACGTQASSGKLKSAFKRLNLSNASRDKEVDVAAYGFHLVPSAEKKGVLHAANGKTHHFAVKTGNERCDWMRDLMLAKALKDKKGGDVVVSSF